MRAYSVVAFALTSAFIGSEPTGNAQEAASSQAPTSLESLTHGLYYQSAQGWKKLEGVTQSGISTKHGASVFAGVPPGAVFNFAGSEALLQIEERRPVFGIRVDPLRPEIPGFNARDLIIVRMSKKWDHREVGYMHGGFASARTGLNSKDTVEVVLTNVAERVFTLTTKADLKTGEYLITFRGANGTSGYDFGIK